VAFFPTNTGGLLGDLGIGVPSNTGGLISDTADIDAINKRALMSGGINALLTYLATPKNLGAGSPLPYLGRAALSGFGAAQNTVDQALNTAYRNRMLAGRDDNLYSIDGALVNREGKVVYQAPAKEAKPRQYTGDFENVAINMYPNIDPTELDEAQRQKVFKSVEKLKAAGALTNLPLKEQEARLKDIETQYRYGTTGPTVNPPKFATMQDVSDTAKATGKTTDQVIKDLQSKGIQVRTK